ncbi:class I SAM-dependent methyltransferase [Epibacterium sp. MM17-32]|uniref:class I SAM-dependent methyltransferase n=1 Tax=Epibacterium sp. MM17-32 TaxID=2917734 RepID=UPI001EF4BD2B|nr:class I SAM-dependent methyltransferase [Epibacterium sp. MM17-32]MCG7630460.1 class I SAM-dependent methyltransferase [Epibacterium sp. MM17-32]
MSDEETMAVYAKAAEDYAKGFARAKDTDHEQDYGTFVAGLPAGGTVLDLGCGPGHWAARFRDDGYRVAAVDASPEMAAYALATYGVEVSVAEFEDIAVEGVFDGIWAFFSLLHAPRDDFPTHLMRLRRALKPGGRLALGMKLGEGEGRDDLGRFYAYYREEELRDILEFFGFTIVNVSRGNGQGLAGAEETFVVLTAHA